MVDDYFDYHRQIVENEAAKKLDGDAREIITLLIISRASRG
jgi:hypothetical protein